MEAKMRERHIPLRTLETKKTLKECDIVGFTLQYELSYTNILNMLDLSARRRTRWLSWAAPVCITPSPWQISLTSLLLVRAKR